MLGGKRVVSIKLAGFTVSLDKLEPSVFLDLVFTHHHHLHSFPSPTAGMAAARVEEYRRMEGRISLGRSNPVRFGM